MKKIIILIITLTTILSAFISEYDYADIKISNKGDIRFLLDNGIDVMKESIPYKNEITSVQVYIKPSQKTFLESKGYKVNMIIDKRTKAEKSKGYRNNARIGVELDSLATVYPTICKRLQIGTSEEGRPIWVMKITDNIDIEEAEPEFKYTSTMHGDEVVPMEFCMELIYDILEGYTAMNDTMTYIVDNTELYILPLHNPDGNEAGVRENANGVDLNRVFPERIYGQENTPVGKEAEVAAMINWSNEHNFVLSSNMHNGAVVVNYPYDADPVLSSGSYVATPDDDIFIFISRGYADRNPSMTAYDNGITNGCEWYEITGGMQDWNYHYYSCMEVTLEVSYTKWPAYSTIQGHWADNRSAMLWYLMAAHKGICGIVTDAVTGNPLDATIQITGIDKDYFTDPDHGDYYRILKPGVYSMMISADGYESKYIYGTEVIDGLATVVDVELDPIGMDSTYPVACEMIGNEIEINNDLPFTLNIFESNEINVVKGVYTVNAASDTITLTPIIGKGFFDYEGIIPAQSIAGEGTIRFLLSDTNGNSGESGEYSITWTDSVGIEEYSVLPSEVVLLQNYPNPFNPITTISFTNDRTQIISVNIYDQAGKLVEKVIDNKFTAGRYSFEFNAEKLSSGIYYNVLRTETGIVRSNKMVFIK